MKKILSLIIIVLLVLSFGACGKKAIAPTTITEMFDGGERVWFYVEGGYSEELSYDDTVTMVFVTKNKVVTQIYYSFGKQGDRQFEQLVCSNEHNPFAYERVTLGDFAGLSNIEVIEKAKESFADASFTYHCTRTYGSYSKSFTLEQIELPYEIKYSGELDHSGNNLQNEIISFAGHDLGYNANIQIGYNNNLFMGSISCGNFEVGSIIEPTEIKDKIYVGIKNDNNECDKIVTINDYVTFDNISYDDPNGVSEW